MFIQYTKSYNFVWGKDQNWSHYSLKIFCIFTLDLSLTWHWGNRAAAISNVHNYHG